MPETVTCSVTAAVAGTPYIQTSSVTANSVERATPSLSAALSGTLSVRTDNTTGTLSLTAIGSIVTSSVIDLFWVGGSRRNVTCGTVSGTTVPISGGSGDSLPAAATAITCMIPTQVGFAADATSTGVAVVAACQTNGWVVFRNSTTVIYAAQVRGGYGAVIWVTGMGANPLASLAVTNVLFSHGDSTQSQTLTAAVVY